MAGFVGCTRDTLELRYPDAPRAEGRVVCGGTWEDRELRVVSFFVVSSCRTAPRLRVNVYAGTEAPIHEEDLAIALIAGREEPVEVRPKLPRQSMLLTLEVEARCNDGEAVLARKDCVAK